MSKFFEKYNVVENVKASGRNTVELTPEERNRLKLIHSIDQQLTLIDALIAGSHPAASEEGSKKPRLFWQEALGGYLFTPRFGNDFMFGKNRGVHCTSYEQLRVLMTGSRKSHPRAKVVGLAFLAIRINLYLFQWDRMGF